MCRAFGAWARGRRLSCASGVEGGQAGVDVFAEDADGFADLVAFGWGEVFRFGVAEEYAEVGQIDDWEWGRWDRLSAADHGLGQDLDVMGVLIVGAGYKNQYLEEFFDRLLPVKAVDAVWNGPGKGHFIVRRCVQ